MQHGLLLSLIFATIYDSEAIVAGHGPTHYGLRSSVALLDATHQVSQAHLPVHDGDASEASEVWPSLLLATIAGASTVIGSLAIFVYSSEGPPPKVMALSMSLAAGVMVAVSAEMVVPALVDCGSEMCAVDAPPMIWWHIVLLFLLGAGGCFLLCKIGDVFVGKSDTTKEADVADKLARDSSGHLLWQRWRLAVLLFVSLTMHNFPEGFAVGITTLSSYQLGATVCIAIACHNIPEGVVIAVSVHDATKSRWKAVLMTAASGLTEPLGALFAVLILRPYLNSVIIQGLLTVVAGIMCYIALAELLPEAFSTRCWSWICSGFLLGVLIMFITHHAMEAVEEVPHVPDPPFVDEHSHSHHHHHG